MYSCAASSIFFHLPCNLILSNDIIVNIASFPEILHNLLQLDLSKVTSRGHADDMLQAAIPEKYISYFNNLRFSEERRLN